MISSVPLLPTLRVGATIFATMSFFGLSAQADLSCSLEHSPVRVLDGEVQDNRNRTHFRFSSNIERDNNGTYYESTCLVNLHPTSGLIVVWPAAGLFYTMFNQLPPLQDGGNPPRKISSPVARAVIMAPIFYSQAKRVRSAEIVEASAVENQKYVDSGFATKVITAVNEIVDAWFYSTLHREGEEVFAHITVSDNVNTIMLAPFDQSWRTRPDLIENVQSLFVNGEAGHEVRAAYADEEMNKEQWEFMSEHLEHLADDEWLVVPVPRDGSGTEGNKLEMIIEPVNPIEARPTLVFLLNADGFVLATGRADFIF
jgi:hypothetical protein